MNKLILKGLLMTLVTFIAQSISTSGIPATGLAWQILGITALGTIITYIAQSVAFPSTSLVGDINLRDLLKGGLVALGNMLSGIGATVISGTSIDWKALAISAGTLLVMYFVKQFATKPTGIPPTK